MNPSLEEMLAKLLEHKTLVRNVEVSMVFDHHGIVGYIAVVNYHGTRFISCAAPTIFEAILACHLAMEAKAS